MRTVSFSVHLKISSKELLQSTLSGLSYVTTFEAFYPVAFFI